jgi:hypothetical protein
VARKSLVAYRLPGSRAISSCHVFSICAMSSFAENGFCVKKAQITFICAMSSDIVVNTEIRYYICAHMGSLYTTATYQKEPRVSGLPWVPLRT